MATDFLPLGLSQGEPPLLPWAEPGGCPRFTLVNDPSAFVCAECEGPRPRPLIDSEYAESEAGLLDAADLGILEGDLGGERAQGHPAVAPAFGEDALSERDADSEPEAPLDFLPREAEPEPERLDLLHLPLDNGHPPPEAHPSAVHEQELFLRQQLEQQRELPPPEHADPPWVLGAPDVALDLKRAPLHAAHDLDGANYEGACDWGPRVLPPEPVRPEPQGLPPSALTFADIQASAGGGGGRWADLSSVAPPECAVFRQPQCQYVHPDVQRAQLAAASAAAERRHVAAVVAGSGLCEGFRGAPDRGLPGAAEPWPAVVAAAAPGSGPWQGCGGSWQGGGGPCGWPMASVPAPVAGAWQPPQEVGRGGLEAQPHLYGHMPCMPPEAASCLAARLDRVIGCLERSVNPSTVLGDLQDIEARCSAALRRC